MTSKHQALVGVCSRLDDNDVQPQGHQLSDSSDFEQDDLRV